MTPTVKIFISFEGEYIYQMDVYYDTRVRGIKISLFGGGEIILGDVSGSIKFHEKFEVPCGMHIIGADFDFDATEECFIIPFYEDLPDVLQNNVTVYHFLEYRI